MVQHHVLHYRNGQHMTQITFTDGKVVMRDGKVGTEQACCCKQCVCGDCPESLGFSVTFYGTRDGTLTFTHPHAAGGSGSASLALCDRVGDSTSYSFYLVEDEALGVGFLNIASATIAVACGPAVDGDGRSWYVSVNGAVAVNAQGDQVSYAAEGIVTACDNNGLPVIDTDALAFTNCTDQETGLELDPCPIRVTVSITT